MQASSSPQLGMPRALGSKLECRPWEETKARVPKWAFPKAGVRLLFPVKQKAPLKGTPQHGTPVPSTFGSFFGTLHASLLGGHPFSLFLGVLGSLIQPSPSFPYLVAQV